jgi:hypothetical protein
MKSERSYSTYPKVSWFDAVIFRGLDSMFNGELTITEWDECYGWFANAQEYWTYEVRKQKQMIYHTPLLLDITLKCIRISNETLMILSRDLPMLCHSSKHDPCPFYSHICYIIECTHPERENQELTIIPNKCPLLDYFGGSAIW